MLPISKLQVFSKVDCKGQLEALVCTGSYTVVESEYHMPWRLELEFFFAANYVQGTEKANGKSHSDKVHDALLP